MIHPDTELRFVSPEIGYGVFATALIPKGTIVYVKDQFEIEITPEEFDSLAPKYREIAEKYSYIEPGGVRIISWDHAKYVNHRCDCNTISTGYGFEIAIRDIQPGEEMTDDYGLFNMSYDIELACNCPSCRKVLSPDDINKCYPLWDSWVKEAFEGFKKVSQPLWDLVDSNTKTSVSAFLDGRDEYRSVLSLKRKNILSRKRSMGSGRSRSRRSKSFAA